MVEYKAVTSSNILGVGYEPETRTLYVEFKGGKRYRYLNVPEEEYEAFIAAPSPGSFFHDSIKDVYQTQRM